MSSIVQKLLELDESLAQLRNQRLETEQHGDTLAVRALDHDLRNLEHARAFLLASASSPDSTEYELKRRRQEG